LNQKSDLQVATPSVKFPPSFPLQSAEPQQHNEQIIRKMSSN
jgi:hypothetical protein